MPFRDRFVLALSFGLAWHLPVGRAAALRLVDIAIARGRLILEHLADTSLLLLVALLPERSPHRGEVLALVATRKLHQNAPEVIRLLRGAAPPRLLDILELGRVPGLHQGAVAFNQAFMAAHQLHVLENLRLYLGRLFLVAPGSAEMRARALTIFARASDLYFQAPLLEYDFLALLYRVARQLSIRSDEALPGLLPSNLPTWFEELVLPNDPQPDAEPRFVQCSKADLSEPTIDILYLHLYGRLNVDQIAVATDSPSHRDQIVMQLEDAWDVVL